MTIKTYDLNFWYSLEVEKCEMSDDVQAISFELNNVQEEVPSHAKIPEETTFVMSIEDAKHLKAFLDVALSSL